MSSPAIKAKESPGTGKWWRVKDSAVIEVEIVAWTESRDYGRAGGFIGFVPAAELFPSEAEALQVAIRQLRDDEQRIYRQWRELMKRLEEIT